MTNAVYPTYKAAIARHAANSNALALTVKAALVDTGAYTYSHSHDFYNDVEAGVVGTPVTVTGFTISANGVFDGDNVVFSAVTGAEVEAIVLFIDTGLNTTSPLIAYIDTGVTGLPVTPNGGDINLNWATAGIFTL